MNRKEIIEKVVRWLIFSVVVALLPLFLEYFSLGGAGERPTMQRLVARGEMLLISSAIAAGAIGDLFGSRDNFRVLKYFIGGFCVILLFLTASWFVDIQNMVVEDIDYEFIANNSLTMFAATVICGALCIILAEL